LSLQDLKKSAVARDRYPLLSSCDYAMGIAPIGIASLEGVTANGGKRSDGPIVPHSTGPVCSLLLGKGNVVAGIHIRYRAQNRLKNQRHGPLHEVCGSAEGGQGMRR
jgi:hypothetical protein